MFLCAILGVEPAQNRLRVLIDHNYRTLDRSIVIFVLVQG